MKVIWQKAYYSIAEADEIVFIGYSFPQTDIAAGFLFREAINAGAKVKVVNLASTTEERARIENTYAEALGSICPIEFIFEGAKEWAATLQSNHQLNLPDLKGTPE